MRQAPRLVRQAAGALPMAAGCRGCGDRLGGRPGGGLGPPGLGPSVRRHRPWRTG